MLLRRWMDARGQAGVWRLWLIPSRMPRPALCGALQSQADQYLNCGIAFNWSLVALYTA
jgi:hypothetical protein